MNLKEQPAPRTPLILEVSFRRSYARNDLSGILKNISLSGAFLEIENHSLSVEEKINLSFIVGSRERKIIAQIVWKNSQWQPFWSDLKAGFDAFNGNKKVPVVNIINKRYVVTTKE